MTIIKTINRTSLKKMIEKGLMEAKCVYYYTDDYQRDGADNYGRTEWLPCRIRNLHDFREGVVNFWESDLTCKGGRAYLDENNIIHLKVHSNSAYELRVKETV